MSTIALYSTLNISETVKRSWFQRTTNRKWHMGYQMVTLPKTSRDPKVLWGSMVGYPSDSLASCINCSVRVLVHEQISNGFTLWRLWVQL